MKKEWNAPIMEELTINATACHGNFGGFGGGFGGGHNGGGHNGGGQPGGGNGNNNVCWCYGGTSPCKNHHEPENGLS